MRLNIVKYAPFIEQARTSLWFVPSIMVMLAILLAFFTVYLDAFYVPEHNLSFPLVSGTDIDAVRSLLGTIAASMITVTSIAFSITIVALTLASSQFGPRLLRNFMMDRGTQVVLGSFISNFLFCILIFCAISFQKPYAFKPGISAVTAILMTFLSVGILIYFIHHVAKSIQADVVIDQVYTELKHSIDKLFPNEKASDTEQHTQDSSAIENNKAHHQNISSIGCGYVQAIDSEKLISIASEHDLLIDCQYSAGDFVVAGTQMGQVFSDQEISKELNQRICCAIHLGAYRTPVQDPEFAIRQLVEIALRALSPGINDPFTAMTCIDKLTAVLCNLCSKAFPQQKHFDQQDNLRLITKAFAFADIGEAAFNQIRQHACGDVAVTIRLLESLQALTKFAINEQQITFIKQQTSMIEQQQDQCLAESDLAQINQHIELVKKIITA